MIETILIDGLAVYALAGVVTAVLFVAFGISRVLDPGTTVTAGARILLFPGAAALWPFVLVRWLTARGLR